jgi:hypothetical protein
MLYTRLISINPCVHSFRQSQQDMERGLKACSSLPMARVKNAKPSTTPTYPRKGRIHMLVAYSGSVVKF